MKCTRYCVLMLVCVLCQYVMEDESPWHSHCRRRWQLTKQQHRTWKQLKQKREKEKRYSWESEGERESHSKKKGRMQWNENTLWSVDDTSPFATAKIIIIETLWLHEFIGFSCSFFLLYFIWYSFSIVSVHAEAFVAVWASPFTSGSRCRFCKSRFLFIFTYYTHSKLSLYFIIFLLLKYNWKLLQ